MAGAYGHRSAGEGDHQGLCPTLTRRCTSRGPSVRTVRPMDTTTHPDQNHTARGAGVVGLGAIALIHLLDLQGKLSETPYLGVAYLVLIIGCIAASGLLIRGDVRRG